MERSRAILRGVDVIGPFNTLSLELDGPIATVTLNRPDVMNRFDEEQHAEFTAACIALHPMAQVRAIVLAASGRYFSAGGDFSIMEEAHGSVESRVRITRAAHELFDALLALAPPVIAAVQGPAIGLGASIALACDAVVASKNVTISDPHVRVGLAAGDGGCIVWPQAVGMLRAKRYLLTGDALTAEEGYKFGLVTDLVDEADDVLPSAMALAERISSLPPLAVQMTKQTLNSVVKHRCAEALDLGLAYELITLSSNDLIEAIAAIKARRSGNYRGN
jgi:enoyl-CoA hydratase